MYNANLVSYTVNAKEYARNVNKPDISPNSIQAYIPSLMPKISMGLPRSAPSISINPSMFANDVSCRPKTTSVLSTQNYVTVPKWPNTQPYFPSKDDGYYRMERYSQFLVDIVNGDIRNMRISNYV